MSEPPSDASCERQLKDTSLVWQDYLFVSQRKQFTCFYNETKDQLIVGLALHPCFSVNKPAYLREKNTFYRWLK